MHRPESDSRPICIERASLDYCRQFLPEKELSNHTDHTVSLVVEFGGVTPERPTRVHTVPPGAVLQVGLDSPQ